MTRHKKGPHELDQLLERPKYLDTQRARSSSVRLHPAVITFLNAVIPPKHYDEGMCYFVDQLDVQSADEFINDDNNFEDIDRFIIFYGTYSELGSQPMGLVYDQEYHRARVPLFIGVLEGIEPIDDYEEW